MTSKKNPHNLNALQLRTLTVLQVLAQVPGAAVAGDGGDVKITRFPAIHGDHFHLGAYVVASKDATGLHNQAVWSALTRKGLARADWPTTIVLTAEGLGYDTGLAETILHRASH